MIDIKQFSELQKQSKQSFGNQRQLIKKVMAGKAVLCSTCHQELTLKTPKHRGSVGKENLGVLCCKKGCTDIQLDFV